MPLKRRKGVASEPHLDHNEDEQPGNLATHEISALKDSLNQEIEAAKAHKVCSNHSPSALCIHAHAKFDSTITNGTRRAASSFRLGSLVRPPLCRIIHTLILETQSASLLVSHSFHRNTIKIYPTKSRCLCRTCPMVSMD
jgi:hypothetical protein